VIVNTFCNFLKQLKYPGDVLAKHYVAKPGRSSFEAYVTLERTDEPGMLYATGGAKTVWVNYREERSVALPAAVRALVG
jgi:acyl-CoA thioester hydrolase